MYKPTVWEFSRLNVQDHVLSKRTLTRLVEEKVVDGWGDPRLLTLMGLKNRGYTPEIIKKFCELVGTTRNENVQSFTLLETCARSILLPISKRVSVLVDPLPLRLLDEPEEHCWVSRNDVSSQGRDDDFFGFAPNKKVHLKDAFDVICTEIQCDEVGTASCVIVKKVPGQDAKGRISWIREEGKDSLRRVELRHYEGISLVRHVGLGSVAALGPIICKGDRFQFERVGFYIADFDDDTGKLFFHLTVSLKSRNQ
jgi:glutaminyl-tRNA synthetase